MLRYILPIVCLLGMGVIITSCGSFPKESAEAQSKRQRTGTHNQATSVNVAIAKKGLLRQQLEYIGNTTPFRTVSVRSQVEGQLLVLNVDVGDALKKGQIVGQVDDTLLRTALNQAEAEMAALKSEVARATNQVSNARAEVEKAKLELQQAKSDAQRQEKLLKAGAIAKQSAEQARTNAQTAAQILRASQEKVQTEQEAVVAAKGRLTAQKAVVEQAKERRTYAKLKSPIAGLVLEKSTEPGNLLQPGNEVLKIGDFNRVKVVVQVSELELANIQVGQSVKVRLDAFPGDPYYFGSVTRISPAADATARLVPVEIVIPNTDGKISSGMLARVKFTGKAQEQIVVPLTAIEGIDSGTEKQKSHGRVFVIRRISDKTTVTARTVKLGKRADGRVEILSGLQPGENYVVRASKPLKEGDEVRLSILSETQESKRQN
ncbi:MAG: efflux RND transporter periplasmic adaptor subunit [Nostocaceae cyanobacterium]|nr:efflux RND transporter periplasmic adaptor subunit [Nostocaceae cyanobacterium]